MIRSIGPLVHKRLTTTIAVVSKGRAGKVLRQQQQQAQFHLGTLNIVQQYQQQQQQNQVLLSRRSYRGDSSDATPTLTEEEEELLKIAKPKADAIYEKHVKLPDGNEDDDALNVRRKRLIYRSKQRGWLEVDLLLGTWASENVFSLNLDELDQYEVFVNMETIDIYNIITLRLDVPDGMKRENGTGVVERIQEWARSSPLGKADPEKYRSVKTNSKLI